ncbi:MAG: peptide chain release factor N(5)-glutamine methyltransferase [Rhodobiaceae bacterium]|nr:peptide chain release factor N(5)-glutamine methyltransferase [Rhodobiaceae bacterium]
MKPPEETPLAALLDEGAARLKQAGLDDPRRRARQVVSVVAGVELADMLGRSAIGLPADRAAACRAAFDRLASGEPLSRIAGRREFWGRDFALSPATLDPRPDTETVIEAVLDLWPDRVAPLRIADLGTGAGAIALTLAAEYPRAHVLATDLNPAALLTARANAAAFGVEDRVQFVCADWLAPISGLFDLVVSNPPYITTRTISSLDRAVTAFDPRLALDGGADGMDCYRAILAAAPGRLNPGGWIVLEIGAAMEDDVLREAARHMVVGESRTWRDLARIVRVVGLRPCKPKS